MRKARSAARPPATVIPVPVRVPCSACGSRRTTSITMTLTDGAEVAFTSCRACEGKSWTGADGPLELSRVLAKATRRRA